MERPTEGTCVKEHHLNEPHTAGDTPSHTAKSNLTGTATGTQPNSPTGMEIDTARADHPGAVNFPGSNGALAVPLLISLAILSAMGPFAIDMYLPAFPAIARDLSTSVTAVQFTLTAFMVGMAVGQLITGPLSDRMGRRGLLLASAIGSVVAAAGCALAPSIAVLIGCRLLLGFAAGSCVVLARSVVADNVQGAAAAKAFSLLMMIQGLAPVIAPVVGGVAAEPLGWRGLFWILTGIAALQVLLVVVVVRESHPAERRSQEPLSATIAAMFGLLKLKAFRGYILAFAFGMGALFAYISASPFVIQEQLGRSELVYSLIFAANSSGIVIATGINAKLVGKADPAQLLKAALTVVTLCGIGLALSGAFALKIWIMVPLMFLMVASMGFILGNATALALAAAGKRAGSAGAIQGFIQMVIAGVMSPLTGIGTNTALTMGICAAVAGLIALVSAVRVPASA